jgi:hypothetical protein
VSGGARADGGSAAGDGGVGSTDAGDAGPGTHADAAAGPGLVVASMRCWPPEQMLARLSGTWSALVPWPTRPWTRPRPPATLRCRPRASACHQRAAALGRRQADPGLHPGHDVPARVQDRGDQVVAGKVPVEADDAASQ